MAAGAGDAGLTGRVLIADDSVPRLAPHVRLRYDEARSRWAVLAPERMLLPDDIAVEVLQRLDGQRTLAAIIDLLAQEFQAERAEVRGDVIDLLQDLSDKGFVTA